MEMSITKLEKARVDGMCSQVTKNQIDAVVQQIKVMQENRKFLLSKCVLGSNRCRPSQVPIVTNEVHISFEVLMVPSLT